MEKPIVSFETDRLYVRSINDSDKDHYMDLCISVSEIRWLYEISEDIREKRWMGDLNDESDIYLAAFLKENNKFVACASFQNYHSDTIEFGFDVTEDYRKQGLATEMVAGMIDFARREFAANAIVISANKDNAASRSVAVKCGGELVGTKPTWAAKALERMTRELDEMKVSDESWEKERMEASEIIENGKDGVCIYRIDI